MDLNEIITQVILMVIGTFLPIVGVWFGFMVRKRLGTINKVDELLMKKDWVKSGVEFAEQTYGALEGPQQYIMAMGYITDRLKENGIKINEREIEGMIERFVYEMKQGWQNYEDDMFHG